MANDSLIETLRKWTFATGYSAGLMSYALGHHAVTRDASIVERVSRQWARRVAKRLGIEVVGYGVENVDPDVTYVFMANHQSYVDVIALFDVLPVLPGFLAKKELRSVPFLGATMEVGGHVFVDRGRHKEAVRAIDEAARQIRGGRSIVIFPEGTRAARNVIRPFKKGGFHLAKQARVAISPIGLRGAGEILRKHDLRIHSGRVEVHIGPAIGLETIDAHDVPALAELVRKRIGELADMPLSGRASSP